MNGTFKYNNKDCNVYKDTNAKLEFIFVDGQEQVFWNLLKEHGEVANIPENILLTGIYFNQGTRDLSPEFENSHIIAHYIAK